MHKLLVHSDMSSFHFFSFQSIPPFPPSPPQQAGKEVKMMVSQPRRIAARTLCNRVRSQIQGGEHLVGLRMGQGVRDEDPRTRV